MVPGFLNTIKDYLNTNIKYYKKIQIFSYTHT